MYNETKQGLTGAVMTPRVASVIENEIQGLFTQTDNLSDIVNTLFERLNPLLRNSNPMTSEKKDEIELTPLAQQIRINKYKVANNVEALKDLLDRLDL